MRTRSRRRAAPLAVTVAVALAATGLHGSAAYADEAPEQIVNGTFDDGTAPWWGTANLTLDVERRPLCADVPGGTVNPWDVIIGQDNIAAGRRRVVRVLASSPRPTAGSGRPGAHPAPGRPVRRSICRASPELSVVRQTTTRTPSPSPVDLPNAQVGVPARRQRRPRGRSAWTTSRSRAAPRPRSTSRTPARGSGSTRSATCPTGPKNATAGHRRHRAAGVAAEERRRRDGRHGQTTPAGHGRQLRARTCTPIDFSSLHAAAAPATPSWPTARPATRSTSAPTVYERAAGRRAEVLLHPAQRHRDPRRAAPRLRPAGRARRRRAQPGRHRGARASRASATTPSTSPAAGTTPATTASTSSTAASRSTSCMSEYERALDARPASRTSSATARWPSRRAATGCPDILDEARWELEFLLSMQVPGGQAARRHGPPQDPRRRLDRAAAAAAPATRSSASCTRRPPRPP